ncbi:6-carboxytetrahydropterin synthase QueD [Candidatus Phycosocius spiralis]|uniref:6-carboxy-5,6,7,8-tetrahydropterin synthase n=1 Tax=Candidatus Phycosocius spiralis TaxID=2815099 RepID=A0ABQ4PT73_9PROT|nr:6-carboxytetrahydropterin synthase QueD [Candidatus Phycosocius spiralis]GIU66199.1 6-carboxy-5,6,7,8-tetrahydropterin synthase [Candidatus Phycosocius spiralis]
MTRCLLTKSVTFDAAHQLHQGDESHPYRRLHGHSFRLDVSIEGEADDKDQWVADFADLSDAITTVRDVLDHAFLNEVAGLETPTLENISVWVAKQLQPILPNLCRVAIARPSLGETCTLEIKG